MKNILVTIAMILGIHLNADTEYLSFNELEGNPTQVAMEMNAWYKQHPRDEMVNVSMNLNRTMVRGLWITYKSTNKLAATEYLSFKELENNPTQVALELNSWEKLHSQDEIVNVCMNLNRTMVRGLWITYKSTNNLAAPQSPISLDKVGGRIPAGEVDVSKMASLPIGTTAENKKDWLILDTNKMASLDFAKTNKQANVPTVTELKFPKDGTWSNQFFSANPAAIRYKFDFKLKGAEFTKALIDFENHKSLSIVAIHPRYTDDNKEVVGYEIECKRK
jgi:hypothetical protein